MHAVRHEADEDSNGGTTVQIRCGYHMRTVSWSIHSEKQKDETSLPSQRTLHRSALQYVPFDKKKVPTLIRLPKGRRNQ